MTPYLILSWRADDGQASTAAQRIRAEIETTQPRWRVVFDKPGTVIVLGGDARALASRIDSHPTFVIGDVFPKTGSGGPVQNLLSAERPFSDLCATLAEDYWGAYLAVEVRRHGDVAVFRDPMGMRDGVYWIHSGVHVFASEAMPWLAVSAPEQLTVDWQRISELLLDSATVAEKTPLSGIETLPPGTLVDIRAGRTTMRRLWSPDRFYERGRPAPLDAATLRNEVLRCVDAWTQTYPNCMIEVSGGLDSATVAAAGAATPARFRHAINFFTDHLSGDERRYARDTCERCHIPLDEVFMPVGHLGDADLHDIPTGVRPGLSSVTFFHDKLLTRIAIGHGVTALFTGHGGDSVFYQHPTAMIAADPSFPRGDIHAYTTLAKWSRESIWTVASHAFGLPVRSIRHTENEALAGLPLCGEVRRAASEWEGEIADFPPAKRSQITAIATDRSVIGPSSRSQALTMLHPLLSQPLVELAIATDIYRLTEGRQDRALVRRAFADMLPASVIERRGKGVLAQYFGRCLCASVPFLRDFLLDGLLVCNDVLDRAELEAMLDRDFLMRFDCYAKLRSVIITEHWARAWQERITAMSVNHSASRAAA